MDLFVVHFSDILKCHIVCSGFLCNTTRGALTVLLLARHCVFKELHTNLLGLDFDGAVLHGCEKRNEKCMGIHSHKNDHSKRPKYYYLLAASCLLLTFDDLLDYLCLLDKECS